MPCPNCGHVARRPGPVATPLRLILDALGPEWTPVRYGASHYYVHKLAARYPTIDWRHERAGLFGDSFTIYARTPMHIERRNP